jgi:hypothetical protein
LRLIPPATMKPIIIFTFLFVTFAGFSQAKKTVQSGYITFNSNAMFEFKNMVIENDSITYYNDVAKSKMGFNLRAVKKIVDNYGTIVYEVDNRTVSEKAHQKEASLKVDQAKKTPEELLDYRRSSKIMLNGKKLTTNEVRNLLKIDKAIYNQYNLGQSNAFLGDILIGGGIGMFVGGGLNNLSNANSGRKGGPELLIIGIVTSLVGIPISRSGVRNTREAVYDYNQLPRKQISFINRADVRVIAGGNGVGLQVQF